MPLSRPTVVRIGPSDIVLDGDPAPPRKTGHSSPPPHFGPWALWPNSCMDRDATWYLYIKWHLDPPSRLATGCRHWPMRHVLDGNPAPHPKKGTSPIFGPCLLWPNGWMDQDATWYGGGPRPRPHRIRWRPPRKGTQPPLFGPCLLW